MDATLTVSEATFEYWCRDRGIEYRRIREAVVQGHKRPDYAIKIQQRWCIVEVKQLDPTRDDLALLQEMKAGSSQARWIDPGARLRRPLRDAAGQLRKFSRRGFPTVVCLVDLTAGFYLERVHIEHAMFGQETLKFEVSSDLAHEPRFLGSHFGKKATLTHANNTSISAVALLCQPSGFEPIIDLHHNPYARVAIPHALSASFVRKQYANGLEDPDRREPTVLDLMQTAEWQEWLDDPEGKFEREVKKWWQEIQAGRFT